MVSRIKPTAAAIIKRPLTCRHFPIKLIASTYRHRQTANFVIHSWLANRDMNVLRNSSSSDANAQRRFQTASSITTAAKAERATTKSYNRLRFVDVKIANTCRAPAHQWITATCRWNPIVFPGTATEDIAGRGAQHTRL